MKLNDLNLKIGEEAQKCVCHGRGYVSDKRAKK